MEMSFGRVHGSVHLSIVSPTLVLSVAHINSPQTALRDLYLALVIFLPLDGVSSERLKLCCTARPETERVLRGSRVGEGERKVKHSVY